MHPGSSLRQSILYLIQHLLCLCQLIHYHESKFRGMQLPTHTSRPVHRVFSVVSQPGYTGVHTQLRDILIPGIPVTCKPAFQTSETGTPFRKSTKQTSVSRAGKISIPYRRQVNAGVCVTIQKSEHHDKAFGQGVFTLRSRHGYYWTLRGKHSQTDSFRLWNTRWLR